MTAWKDMQPTHFKAGHICLAFLFLGLAMDAKITAVTQNDTVLLHLQQFGEITALQAISHYQITRLSARIYELREAGYRIESKKQHDGDGKRGCYARYVLRRD